MLPSPDGNDEEMFPSPDDDDEGVLLSPDDDDDDEGMFPSSDDGSQQKRCVYLPHVFISLVSCFVEPLWAFKVFRSF